MTRLRGTVFRRSPVLGRGVAADGRAPFVIVERPKLGNGRFVLVLIACAVLTFPAATVAYVTPAKLTEVARVYALGVGEVRCPSSAEWNADFSSSFAWAYTNMREAYVVLAPLACDGALNVGSGDVPLWQQALGVLVLTHEAFHLRRWRFRRDEGKVECQSMVYFKDAAQRLGATADFAENLYPYALAWHWHKLRLFPSYRDPNCLLPPWTPPAG